MIDDKSYIHIGGWMINELKLKGNELYVYAIIYSFTNGTDDHYFNGSLSYLSERTNSSKSTIQRTLKDLLDKGLINKVENYENGIKFVKYSTVNRGYSQNDYGIVKMTSTHSQNDHGGIVKMTTNNTSIYTNNIQEKEKESLSDLDIALNDLIEARKKLRKPMTDRAIKLVKNKLERMYPGDTEMQIICINQSIERGWQSVFEVKEEDLKYYKKPPKPKKKTNLLLT